MSLGRRLKAIADGLSAKAPDAAAAIHGYLDELRATGIENRVIRAGVRAPGFTLEDTVGQPVSLDSLVRQGPVILTFYRGRW